MRLELHMSLDGAAMRGADYTQPDAAEVAECLRDAADYLAHAWVGEVEEIHRIKDGFGNRIGYWVITEASAEVDA